MIAPLALSQAAFANKKNEQDKPIEHLGREYNSINDISFQMLDLFEKSLRVMAKTKNVEQAKKNVVLVAGCRREIELLVPLLKKFGAPEEDEIKAYAKRTWDLRKPMGEMFAMDEKISTMFEGDLQKIMALIGEALGQYYPEVIVNEHQLVLSEKEQEDKNKKSAK